MKKIILLLVILFDFSLYGAFDNMGRGSARSIGLGGAVVSLPENFDGLLYNPATLYGITGINSVISGDLIHSGLDWGRIFRTYISLLYGDAKSGTGSIGFNYLGVDVNNKTIYSEKEIIVGYGTKILENLATGISILIPSWDAANSTAGNDTEDLGFKKFRISINMGFLYNAAKDINIGINFKNINQPQINSKSSLIGEKLALIINTGFSIKFKKFLLLTDYECKKDETNISGGIEIYLANKRLSLRTAFNLRNITEGLNICLGAGFVLKKKVIVDYSMIYPLNGIGNTIGTHKLSLNLRI